MVMGVLQEYGDDGTLNSDDPCLTKEQCHAFIYKIMEETNEIDAWDEAEFEKCYGQFDKDGGGTISQDELSSFISKFAKLWVNLTLNDLG